MGTPCMTSICIIPSRGGDPVRGMTLLKKYGSILLKQVFTLPRMVLYFMQPITFNESLFRDWFGGNKKW